MNTLWPRCAVLGILLLAATLHGGCAPTTSDRGHAMFCTSPESVLDALHAAAARADGPAYFALFAPDAVFLGTDASERWTLEQFKDYAQPLFAQGKGWTYTPSDRHVAYSPDGRVAWFDERVTNAKYGECRGTGVLVLTSHAPAGWRIAQYNLTKPVPNEMMEPFMDMLRHAGHE